MNHRQERERERDRLLFQRSRAFPPVIKFTFDFIFRNRDEMSRDNVVFRSLYQQLRATRKYAAVVASSCVHFTSTDSSGSGAN